MAKGSKLYFSLPKPKCSYNTNWQVQTSNNHKILLNLRYFRQNLFLCHISKTWKWPLLPSAVVGYHNLKRVLQISPVCCHTILIQFLIHVSFPIWFHCLCRADGAGQVLFIDTKHDWWQPAVSEHQFMQCLCCRGQEQGYYHRAWQYTLVLETLCWKSLHILETYLQVLHFSCIIAEMPGPFSYWVTRSDQPTMTMADVRLCSLCLTIFILNSIKSTHVGRWTSVYLLTSPASFLCFRVSFTWESLCLSGHIKVLSEDWLLSGMCWWCNVLPKCCVVYNWLFVLCCTS